MKQMRLDESKCESRPRNKIMVHEMGKKWSRRRGWRRKWDKVEKGYMRKREWRDGGTAEQPESQHLAWPGVGTVNFPWQFWTGSHRSPCWTWQTRTLDSHVVLLLRGYWEMQSNFQWSAFPQSHFCFSRSAGTCCTRFWSRWCPRGALCCWSSRKNVRLRFCEVINYYEWGFSEKSYIYKRS